MCTDRQCESIEELEQRENRVEPTSVNKLKTWDL